MKARGYTNQTISQRAALENALAELTQVEHFFPVTRLRVCQARDRGGLSALLGPAIQEMDEMSESIVIAKAQVHLALSRLVAGEGDQ